MVTGGEGDLARAIKAEFLGLGYDVIAPGREELDVTRLDQVDSFFREIENFEVLVNNAGMTRDKVHTKLEEDDWDAVLDANLKGSFLCSQAALKHFLGRGKGCIINIGSFSGKCPPVGQANYAAAKAGVVALTQSLAKEYGKRNIRVNAVLPGFLETKMTAGLSENALARIRERHALERFNTTEDAARFIGFLVSMEQVSGQVFQLDSRV